MEIFASVVLASIAMATIGLGIDVVVHRSKKESNEKSAKNKKLNKKLQKNKKKVEN